MANKDGFPDKIPVGATDDSNGDAAAVGTVDGEEAGTEEPTLEILLEGAMDSAKFENGVTEGVALLSTAAIDDIDGIDEAAETLLGASLGSSVGTVHGLSEGNFDGIVEAAETLFGASLGSIVGTVDGRTDGETIGASDAMVGSVPVVGS